MILFSNYNLFSKVIYLSSEKLYEMTIFNFNIDVYVLYELF